MVALAGCAATATASAHRAAYTSSKYLARMLNDDLIAFTPSSQLDSIYDRPAPRRSPSGIPESPIEQEAPSAALLRRDMLPELVKTFELRESAEGELARAVMQIDARLHQAETERASKPAPDPPSSRSESRTP